MKLFCQIINGEVVNCAEFPDTGVPKDWPERDQWIASDTNKIGWSYANGKFVPPPAPEPVPPTPEEIARLRNAAYRAESDPVLFDVLAEKFKNDPAFKPWIDTREAVKARLPKEPKK